MSFETDFYAHLTALLGAGTTVRFGYVESKDRPFVALTIEDYSDTKTTEGVTSAKSIEVLVECVAKSPSEARDLAAQIKAAYEDFSGSMGSYTIDFSRAMGQSDSDDHALQDFLRSFSLIFTYKATS